MLPASNRGTGMNAGFPDTCNTPQPSGTAPIPYPNIANASSASTFSSIVYVGMVNALNLNSSIPNTSGDEAGTAQPNMGKAGYTTGNPIVYVEKVPAINFACPTNGNNSNCNLAAVVVPAVSVVSYTYAADAGAFRSGGLTARRTGAPPASSAPRSTRPASRARIRSSSTSAVVRAAISRVR